MDLSCNSEDDLEDLADQNEEKQKVLDETLSFKSNDNVNSGEEFQVKSCEYDFYDVSKNGTDSVRYLGKGLNTNPENSVSKNGHISFSSLKSSLAKALQNGVLNSTPEKTFLCSECPQTFITAVELDEHFRIHEKLIEKVVSVPVRKRRVKMRPSRLYPSRCDVCQISFNNRNEYKDHSVLHSDSRDASTTPTESLTICNFCGTNISEEVMEENHINHESKVKTNFCRHCQLTNFQSDETAKNIKLESAENPLQESQLEKIVKRKRKRLKNKLLVYEHYETDDSQPRKYVRKKKRSVEHKPFLCELCGNRFNTLSNLERHNKVHTGEKPYTCKICDKSYAYMHALKQHYRIHTQEKPYICEFCGKAFARQDYLKEHLRVHTKEKPYTCKICGRGFSQSGSLKLHQKVHISRTIDM